MAYQARHTDSNNNAEIERNNKNNANNVRNAAKVAQATGNPYAVAAGKAVDLADKVTGGKSSEALGKALTKANQNTPGGRQLQEGLNKLNESGASDKIGQAADLQNGQAPTNSNTKNNTSETPSIGGLNSKKSPSSFFDGGEDPKENEKYQYDSTAILSGMIDMKKVLAIALPAIGVFLIFAIMFGAVGGGFSEYNDALGAASASGGQTGDINFEPSSKEAKGFYERINNVKQSYQARGKIVDSLNIAAVYHVLNTNNNTYDYDYMTTNRIEEIADSMFNGNIYDETTFKNNLTNYIFLKYFPYSTVKERENYTDDVFDYINRYFSFIGEEKKSTCASLGSCSYDIDGFYIHSKGNVTKKLQFSNLYVRLMQCGTGSGHNYGGTWGEPLGNEELIPFEKYILGVAYAEIGSSAPDEAIKAQMVAARSYILARPFDMGGWRTLKQESDGKWVLQVAACTQDHVFCNPDRGCSGYDAQWGQVHSGLDYTGFQRQPLSPQHRLRTLANATMGEVLVNNQGYIIYTGYKQSEQNQFTSLANQGMNYRQILLQVYNQGKTDYNATDINKMSCNIAGSAGCGGVATGPYASWKQYQGPWINVRLGGGGTIREIGCLATSISMLIAKSGTPTVVTDFNPGTFVETLNNTGGFDRGGNFNWGKESTVAPNFHYQGQMTILNYNKTQKLQAITQLLSQGYYIVAEVKGNTGQHWVAIDAVAGETIIMMDPGSSNTDMWAQYDWRNTSRLAYFKVS